MSAQEILRMIEEVDPADTAKLDEIDARVWCYLNDKPFAGMLLRGNGFRYLMPNQFEVTVFFENGNVLNVSASRDALKAIRPEGWNLEIEVWGKPQARCTIWKRPFCDTGIRFSRWLPTEELAELHAIIQAIEHERTKGETK